MKNCIFYVANDAYFGLLKCSINSLGNYENHPEIFVFYRGDNCDNIQWLSDRGVVRIDTEYDLSEFDGFDLGVMSSKMCYTKLLMWSNLFGDYDNVIYLDCDTIVLGSLDEVALKNEFFAVSDGSDTETVFFEKYLGDSGLINLSYRCGFDLLDLNKSMINSGFMVVPKRLRSKEYYSLLLDIAKDFSRYGKYADQSVISIWAYMLGIKGSHDYNYNFQTHFIFTSKILSSDFRRIKVIHFSQWKPDTKYCGLLKAAEYIRYSYCEYLKYSV